MREKLNKYSILIIGILVIIAVLLFYFLSKNTIDIELEKNMISWLNSNPDKTILEWNNLSAEFRYGDVFNWFKSKDIILVLGSVIGGATILISLSSMWN